MLEHNDYLDNIDRLNLRIIDKENEKKAIEVSIKEKLDVIKSELSCYSNGIRIMILGFLENDGIKNLSDLRTATEIYKYGFNYGVGFKEAYENALNIPYTFTDKWINETNTTGIVKLLAIRIPNYCSSSDLDLMASKLEPILKTQSKINKESYISIIENSENTLISDDYYLVYRHKTDSFAVVSQGKNNKYKLVQDCTTMRELLSYVKTNLSYRIYRD